MFRIIFFFFCCSHFALADCGEVRLDARGGSLDGIPVYDQDGVYGCFAYPVAQLYDAYRFSHGDKRRDHLTSPLATVLFTYQAKNFQSLEDFSAGAYEAEALSAIETNGSCSHKIVGDQFGSSTNQALLEELKKYFQEYTSGDAQTKSQVAGELECRLEAPSLFAQDLGNYFITQSLNSQSYVGFTAALFRELCKEDSIPAIPFTMGKFVPDEVPTADTRPQIIQLLDQRLVNNQSLPVIVTICDDVFKSYTSKMGPNSRLDKTACSGAHSVLVVGRRMHNGSCELLVRNSWGTSCQFYPGKDCRKGQIWLDEKGLVDNVETVTYLNP